MCGFAGYLSNDIFEHSENILVNMGEAIKNRGPDSGGVWESTGIGLTHRRLAILDISEAGHQPMVSVSGRYVISFNGEIYNHLALRDMLLSQYGFADWKGTSDTETLLACFEHLGVDNTLVAIAGMFAISIWDREIKELILVRDRMGEKPLYYGLHGNTFLFGSELKALKIHPSFISNIYRPAITLLFRLNYIPAPYSIYENTYKLEPGQVLRISSGDLEPRLSRFWNAGEVIQDEIKQRVTKSAEAQADTLESLLDGIIKDQMIADVSVGAFLSGGIDSSAVVALMQKHSTKSVKTFTIGFDDLAFDESSYAKAVADHLKTEHHEMRVTAQDSLAVIPDLPSMYDEPFSDASQIPTYLVSKVAKESVTVALSGDGGDEIFCGYNRYKMASRYWPIISKLPLSVRGMASQTLTFLPPSKIDQIAGTLPFFKGYGSVGDKAHKLGKVIGADSVRQMYVDIISKHSRPESLVINGEEPETVFSLGRMNLEGLSGPETMMALDTVGYLPDGVLTKTDRATMAVSLEGRAPFLDHRLFEFAWKLPMDLKIRDGKSKWILRQVLSKYVPDRLIDRPKMGFGVPLRTWLVGPLRQWAEELLAQHRLEQEGYLNAVEVRKIWRGHLSGSVDHSNLLWSILMFQAWLTNQHVAA